jgi:hypothetical protein
MEDPNVFDQMSHHGSHFEEFVRPAVAAGVGYWIGHKLSQTRLGQRFENSTFVGYVLSLALIGIGGYVLYCAGVFVWMLLKILVAG